MPYCLSCGAEIDEYDSGYYSRNMLCIPCYDRKAQAADMVSCSRCGTRVPRDSAESKKGSLYCSYCYSELERLDRIPICSLCNKNLESYQKSLRLSNGKTVHLACATAPNARVKVFCAICGKETDYFRVSPAGLPYCSRCDKSGAASTPASAASGVSVSHDHPLLESLVGRIGSMIG